jgi:hypothetical protein
MSDDPTQPGGWGLPPEQPPQRPWGEPPPPDKPSDKPPWWRSNWFIATVAFLLGAWVGNARANPEPQQVVRTVTVTSVVTSLVPMSTLLPPPTAAPTTRRPATTRPATTRAPTTTRGRVTATTAPPKRHCDPSYPTVCIPPPPPDLDCSEIPYQNFAVRPPDPHGFDNDNDGVGCER